MNRRIWSNYDFLVDNGCIWFVSYWNSFICRYSFETKKIELIELVPNVQKDEFAYSNIVKKDNEIFLIPANADNVCIFNILNQKFDFIQLDETRGVGNKFFATQVVGDYLYMFPCKYPAILRINIRTHEKKYISDWVNGFDIDDAISIFRFDYIMDDKRVMLLSSSTNKILEFEFSTEKSNVYEIGKDIVQYSVFTEMNDGRILLADDMGNVVIWNKSQNGLTVVYNNVEGFVAHRFDNQRATFADAIQIGDIVYLFPGQANKILQFNIRDNCAQEATITKIFDNICKGELFSTIHVTSRYILGFRMDINVLWCYDIKKREESFLPIEIGDLGKNKIVGLLQKKLAVNFMIKEGDCFTLNDFLNGLLNM